MPKPSTETAAWRRILLAVPYWTGQGTPPWATLATITAAVHDIAPQTVYTYLCQCSNPTSPRYFVLMREFLDRAPSGKNTPQRWVRMVPDGPITAATGLSDVLLQTSDGQLTRAVRP